MFGNMLITCNRTAYKRSLGKRFMRIGSGFYKVRVRCFGVIIATRS